MRSKKSQITIFIIAGIVILFAAFLFLFVRTQILKQPVDIPLLKGPLEVQPVKSFVDACVRDSLIKGGYVVASQGGYALPKTDSLITENFVINYAYDDGLVKAPSSADVGKQLAEYIRLTLPVCTGDFESFKNQGYLIVEEQPDASVSVGMNSMTATVTYPLTITFANKTSKLSDFQSSAPIRMGRMLDVVKSIADDQDNETVSLNDLGDFGFNVTIIPYGTDTLIYTIHDPSSTVEGAPFTFSFASRSSGANSAPELEFIPDFVLAVNETFTYTVLASDPDGDSLIFADNTELFDINPDTGEIVFTPRASGTAEVLISVIDSSGNSHSQFMRLTIR